MNNMTTHKSTGFQEPVIKVPARKAIRILPIIGKGFVLLFKLLWWVILIARIPVFWVMLWARIPLRLVLELLMPFAMFGFFFLLIAMPEKKDMIWTSAIISIGSLAVMWIYDMILMAIAPHDMMTFF